MGYDFDTVVDRRGTNCLKYDFARERGKPEDVLPFWVADMDFPTAPAVTERLGQMVRHGIFGYSDGKEEYFRALENWYGKYFGWKTREDWLVKTPGVVFALAMAVRAFTEEGGGVMIQQPVYYPFHEVIRDNNRKLVNNPLKNVGGRYEMDFEDFEKKAVEQQVKLFLLCSPHNPVGRVWKEWELRKVGEICLKHGVTVVSDEIHSDFAWQDNRHQVFAALSPAYSDITVTCTAPSKTFNIAGLQISNIFISNPELRKKFRHEVSAAGYSQVNAMGLMACQAAYEGGEEWLREVKQYIWDNYLFLREYLGKRVPKVRVGSLEGTYLVWLDFRDLGLTEAEREKLIVDRARIWLDSGAMFGADGEGYERINIACPRSVLAQALEQLVDALEYL